MKLASVIGQTLDEKYLVERQLGKGGMGAVFLATHLGTGRHVAVKIIMPQFMQQDEFVERFRREARAAGRLRHPNVVDVTDFGFAQLGAERVAYLVMEYLDGCTLDEVLEEEERLPVSWVVDILEQVCSAVDEAHQQGIIHRDLKPDNIWLEPNRRGGYTVKVLDFGIAKLEEGAVGADSTNGFDASADSLGGRTRNGQITSHSRTVSEDASTLITGAQHGAATNIEGGAAAARARATRAVPSEGATLIAPIAAHAPAPGSEGVTLIAPASTRASTPAKVVLDREGATQILSSSSVSEHDPHATSASSSLTRVGALLGTPLYMSPEQCHGHALDPRSDVYSLGVIAYRMLSGATPFSGSPTVVMQQHKEQAPPPLIAPKASTKLKRVVMSALAKDPSDRPANAAALANSLRSYSEGVGQLIQSGLLLFLQYLPTFVKLSLLVYAPMIFVTVAQTSLTYLRDQHYLSTLVHGLIGGLLGLFSAPVQVFTPFVVSATTTWLVTQMLGAPLRPVRLRSAFTALVRRKWAFIGTVLLMMLFVVLSLVPPAVVMVLVIFVRRWLIVLAIPALVPFVYVTLGYALTIPVVMMEDLSGRAALRRSLELAWRAKRTVVATLSLHFLVPIVLALATAGVIVSIIKALGLPGGVKLFNLVFPLIWLPAQVVLGGVAAVITALLYLKTRQAGGEPVRILLRDLEETGHPQTQWQQRMRERLHTTGVRNTR